MKAYRCAAARLYKQNYPLCPLVPLLKIREKIAEVIRAGFPGEARHYGGLPHGQKGPPT